MPFYSGKTTPNFIYPDGSGLWFDLPPRDVIWGYDTVHHGGIYEVPKLPSWPEEPAYTGWTQWMERWQKDYRFASVSDYNALLNDFPEVQDPWMFTESVFEGTARKSDRPDADPISSGVVEPPLVSLLQVDRTEEAETALVFFNDQPATVIAYDEKPIYDIEYRWESEVTGELFWARELAAMRWQEQVSSGEFNDKFKRLDQARRIVSLKAPAMNSGVRSYRHRVWSQSLRWGHSQNVPPRTLGATAPREFLRPDAIFTGRIVPQVTITSGAPIYDNLHGSDYGQQAVFMQTLVSVGTFSNDAKITLFTSQPTPLEGEEGDHDTTYGYNLPDSIDDGVNVDLPKISAPDTVGYKWTDVNFANEDLVHRGCAFWVGSGGVARCKYAQDNAALFDASPDTPKPVTHRVLCATYSGETSAEARSNYVNDGGECPYYTPQGARVLAAFTGEAKTLEQLSRLRRFTGNAAPGSTGVVGLGATLFGFIPNGSMVPPKMPSSTDPNAGYSQTFAEVTYEPQYASVAGKKTFYDNATGESNPNNPEEDLRVIPGTGFFPLDETSNAPVRGADSVLFGMVNQINYRIMRNVQHCYKSDRCDMIIKTRGTAPGFQRGRYSGVNFQDHALTMPGYPAVDGRDSDCHYGNGMCPYGQLDRRAVEFNENYKILLKEILLPFRIGGIGAFESHNLIEAFLVDGTLVFPTEEQVTPAGAPCVAVWRDDDSGMPVLGHFHPVIQVEEGEGEDTETVDYRIFFLYDKPSWDENHHKSQVAAHLIQFDDSNNPCYTTVGEDDTDAIAAIYGDADQVPWLLELHEDYREPAGNAVWVTNGERFWGGRSPEYKNHSLRGREILCSWGGYGRSRVSSSMTPNQFGGVIGSRDRIGDRGVRGYWTDEDGEFIVKGATAGPRVELPDGLSGSPVNSVPISERIKQHPPVWPFNLVREWPSAESYGSAIPDDEADTVQVVGLDALPGRLIGGTVFLYDGVSSVSRTIDKVKLSGDVFTLYLSGSVAETHTQARVTWLDKSFAYPINGLPGQTLIDNTTGTRVEHFGYAAMGATYSNDTKELYDWYAVRPPGQAGDTNYTNWELGLPEDPRDPEHKLPILPPGGDPKNTPVERYGYRCSVCGVEVTEEEESFLAARFGAPVKCPRGDDGDMEPIDGFDHIPSSLGRGYVDVWAPPGTTVQHNAFFWKVPAIISRLHETQISQKLGAFNPAGGGYTFENLSPGMEQMGAPPLSKAGSYSPGIDRRLLAPWALPGDTVSTVRSRVARWFSLDRWAARNIVDYACVVRGLEVAEQIERDDEDGYSLQDGDLVLFMRKRPDGRAVQVGLLVHVSTQNIGLLEQETLVDEDSQMPTEPSHLASDKDILLYDHRMRMWLLNAVDRSFQHWSSSVTASRNLLATKITEDGGDPNLAKPFHPGQNPNAATAGVGTGSSGEGAAGIDIDERLLGPYADLEANGLKLVTLPHMKRLRNRILPMLAYDLSMEGLTYSAGGDYNLEAQAANLQRFAFKPRGLQMPVYGTIPPQVLAATSTGRDSFVEWNNADEAIMTRGRAYYPVGQTWWRINRMVGHIKRSGGTNPLHLDADPDTIGDALYSYYRSRGMSEYTGDEVVSTATFFMHGRLPMDKEVAKAYIVFKTANGPTAGALGCLGEYDGYEGRRSRNLLGQDLPDDGIIDAVYRGNEECFWQHYHPWGSSHENDIGSYAQGAIQSTWGSPAYSGPASKDHWEIGPFEGSAGPHVMSSNPTSHPEMAARFENSMEDMQWRWRSNDDTARQYTHAVSLLGSKFVDDSAGFRFAQAFIGPWSWGQDMEQLVTEHQAWKEMTYAEYAAEAQKYSAGIEASANTIGAITSFTYFAAPFRNRIMPRQLQGIPGWFDYTNYDKSGRVAKKLLIEAQEFDYTWANGPQVIVQSSVDAGAASSGGNGLGQAGDVERVLDVTDLVRKQYNARVARFFTVQLGAEYDELFDLVRSKTDTNHLNAVILDSDDNVVVDADGQAVRFHEGAPGEGDYEPLYWWNYRYMEPEVGMWLTDPWHMPPLDSTGARVTAAAGDEIVQVLANRKRRVLEVTGWDTEGEEFDSDEYWSRHPFWLSSSTLPSFPDDGQDGDAPSPAAGAGYWQQTGSLPFTGWFVMDLRQVPYETERRPWRYVPPKTDASGATCPNVKGCWVAYEGLTMGQLFEQSIHKTWGGIVPHMDSPLCPICATELDGVVETSGDGITTVAYDPDHEDDVLINAVDVGILLGEEHRHGFVVDAYVSSTQRWTPLFSVTFNQQAGEFVWREWDGSAFTEVQSATLPLRFLGWPGDGKGGLVAGGNGRHFPLTPAQKIRFRIPSPAAVEILWPPAGYATATLDVDSRKITITGQGKPDVSAAALINQTVVLHDGQEITEAKIRSVRRLQDDLVEIHTDSPISHLHTSVQLKWTEYVAGCTKFRPFGFPYYKGEVTITPPPLVLDLPLGNSGSVRMVDRPSQIVRVTAMVGDDPSVPLEETEDLEDDFHWQTVEESLGDDRTYLRVVGGKWHYDYASNAIRVPNSYLDENGDVQPIGRLNSDLYLGEEPLTIDTIPSALSIYFISGLGMPLNVGVEAAGDGPSYQMGAECVSFILNNSDDQESPPAGIASTTLPDIGESVRLRALEGERFDMRWHCYNHQPITWERDLGWLTGAELGQGAWDDNSVMDAYTGKRGFKISQINGTNSFIRGRAKGEVTLYGAGGVMLSGDLAVYAKATTTRSWTGEDGVETTIYERTGGFEEGAIVFRLKITDDVVNTRKAVMCQVPRLLVYLKERNAEEQV